MQKKIIFLIQARLGSTRLPSKVLKNIKDGVTLLEFVLNNIKKSKYSDIVDTVVLTTTSEKDNKLVEFCENKNIPFFRGSEKNVYDRFFQFLKKTNSDYFFRVCSDNPFIEPKFIDALIEQITCFDYDYISFAEKEKPAILTHYGFFVELVNTKTFLKNNENILNDTYSQEHVTPFLYKTQHYSTKFLQIPDEIIKSGCRLTIDTEEDFSIVREIMSNLQDNYDYKDVLKIISGNHSFKEKMNNNILKNEK